MTHKAYIVFLILIFLSACDLPWKRQKSNALMDEIIYPEKTYNFPPGFVKDPGKAGEQTIHGIDSDGDGVRDDLQRWIYARYPNDSKKRGALKQAVVAFQDWLKMNETDYNQRRKNDDQMFKSMHCISHRMGIRNDEFDYVQAKVLNTQLRTKRYFEVSRAYDGDFISNNFSTNESACEYEY
jgi:hypothetical protein